MTAPSPSSPSSPSAPAPAVRRLRRAALAGPLVVLLAAGVAGCMRFTESDRPSSHGPATVGPTHGGVRNRGHAGPLGGPLPGRRVVPAAVPGASASGTAPARPVPGAPARPAASASPNPPALPHPPVTPPPPTVDPSAPAAPTPPATEPPTTEPTPPPGAGDPGPSGGVPQGARRR